MNNTPINAQGKITINWPGLPAIFNDAAIDDFIGAHHSIDAVALPISVPKDVRFIGRLSIGNLNDLTARLSQLMAGASHREGLGLSAPVSINLAGHNLQIYGFNNAASKWSTFFSKDKQARELIENTLKVASEMYAFVAARHLSFAKEYSLSGNSSQVLNKYRHEFNHGKEQQMVVLNFDGHSVSLTCNGQIINADFFRQNKDWMEH